VATVAVLRAGGPWPATTTVPQHANARIKPPVFTDTSLGNLP